MWEFTQIRSLTVWIFTQIRNLWKCSVTLDSATNMAYYIMVQTNSTRWRHYIEMGPSISSEYSRECRYRHGLNIVRPWKKHSFEFIWYIYIKWIYQMNSFDIYIYQMNSTHTKICLLKWKCVNLHIHTKYLVKIFFNLCFQLFFSS